MISNDPGKYHYVAQGMLTIDNVDDAEEMKLTDEAFDVLGFTKVRPRVRDASKIRSSAIVGGEDEHVQVHGCDHALR